MRSWTSTFTATLVAGAILLGVHYGIEWNRRAAAEWVEIAERYRKQLSDLRLNPTDGMRAALPTYSLLIKGHLKQRRIEPLASMLEKDLAYTESQMQKP